MRRRRHLIASRVHKGLFPDLGASLSLSRFFFMGTLKGCVEKKADVADISHLVYCLRSSRRFDVHHQRFLVTWSCRPARGTSFSSDHLPSQFPLASLPSFCRFLPRPEPQLVKCRDKGSDSINWHSALVAAHLSTDLKQLRRR